MELIAIKDFPNRWKAGASVRCLPTVGAALIARGLARLPDSLGSAGAPGRGSGSETRKKASRSKRAKRKG